MQKKFAAPESLACPIEFFGDVYSMLIHIHMFTGIIEKTSRILSAETRGRCRRVTLEKPEGWKLAPGESISIDGICSTVTARTRDRFDVEYMPETLSKTTAALFTAGRIVNLERSLRYGDRVHGHFVAGHVDGRGRIVAVKKEGRTRMIRVSKAAHCAAYLHKKGSVAINGVSLTIVATHARTFDVALIPYTLSKTSLRFLEAGTEVNIECDMLARYNLVTFYPGGTVPRNAKKGGRNKKPKKKRV